jgi:three-Cys-motif partner protein
MTFKFDDIGYWSEIKLDIIEKYALPYSKILSGKLHHVYIDAFASSGMNISRTTRKLVRGSPQIALDIDPPFEEYYFIDTDGEKIAELNKIAENHLEVYILHGDCNTILLTEVFPKVRWKDKRRGLCLLDPYGLDLNWQVIKTAGEMRSIDMILNFPVMAMNRNVLWRRNLEGIDPSDINRMNAFWGDDSWKTVAYRPVTNLFGETVEFKENNNTIALAFKERLINVAGFKYVPDPIPMRNSNRAIIYYLFFASQQQVAHDIMKDIFDKYRNRGMY